MKVLIVSKTHMNTGVCVGGITFDGRFVRLLDNNGHNQSDDCPFKINEAYDITFIEKQNPTPPHIEDILAYIIHSGFISGYQNRYGDNLKPPTNVYHRMTA